MTYQEVLQQSRGIMGPAGMSEEATKFWSDIFEKVCATDAWAKDYAEAKGLTATFMGYEEYKAYYEANEKALVEKAAALGE